MFKHPHCGGQHATAAEARACQGAPAKQPATVGAAGTTAPAPGTLSSKQQGFIARLATERDTTGEEEFLAAAKEGTLGRADASAVIDRLLKAAKVQAKATAPTNLPDVPEGHYAIPSTTGNNDLDFFRVDRPTDGKWAGYTFLKRVVGGKPDLPVARAQRAEVLQRIVDTGIYASRKQYADAIGRCYACNRHLTDETSRALGIGPECRKKG